MTPQLQLKLEIDEETAKAVAAYEEGFDAFNQGKDFFEHGKELLSDEWSYWTEGWYAARDEKIESEKAVA